MAENSGISWTDHTFNPWRGCTKVSPACAACYAERHESRFGTVQWGPSGNRVLTSAANWQKPIRWNREAERAGVRQRVFCASLADVFEAWDGPIRNSSDQVLNDRFMPAHNADMHNDELLTMDLVRRRLFELIDATPNLDWLLLTKRPENIARMCCGYTGTNIRSCYRPNVWLGCSVENSDYLHRIDTLKSCERFGQILFLSCEPLLSDLPTLGEHLDGIDWVIGGGESGPSARRSCPEWFRSVRDQCEAHNVPFHFKQWGEYGPDGARVGVKQAGRVLDGVEHDGFPLVAW